MGIGLEQADTLIRATLHIDPTILSDDEWIYQAVQAVWMEDYRVNRMAKLFAKE